MKQTHILIATLAGALSACSGGTSSHQATWEQMPVVAHTIDMEGKSLTVCPIDLLEDTVNIPLSDLVEEPQLVRLDNREEALVGSGGIRFSDNYILVLASQNVPCKLFRKDGTYINKVGSIGQGPGEYKNIYDAQIDEVSGRIYLLPWSTNRILVYDLQGKFERHIPLNKKYANMVAPKGVFQVDAEKNRISVVALPFPNLPVVAWVQDMEGNYIHELPAPHLRIAFDFSNEVLASKATEGDLSFHISTFFEPRQDTLYHLNAEQGKLMPQFTIDFGSRKIGPHHFYELPSHYYGYVSDIKQTNNNLFEYDNIRYFIVEKATGKGNYCRIYDDYLYDREVTWLSGTNGYYYRFVEPIVLMEEIQKALDEHPEWNEERRQKLETLKDSFNENDNNYIILGKLKGKE